MYKGETHRTSTLVPLGWDPVEFTLVTAPSSVKSQMYIPYVVVKLSTSRVLFTVTTIFVVDPSGNELGVMEIIDGHCAETHLLGYDPRPVSHSEDWVHCPAEMHHPQLWAA